MRRALEAWGSGTISLSARIVVLKAVASAIPVYHMAAYKAPVGVVKEIENLMRQFLWNKRGGECRIAWVRGNRCVSRGH